MLGCPTVIFVENKVWFARCCFTVDLSKTRLMYDRAVLSGRDWFNFVVKITFGLCCTARARKREEEQSKTGQEADIVSRFC